MVGFIPQAAAATAGRKAIPTSSSRHAPRPTAARARSRRHGDHVLAITRDGDMPEGRKDTAAGVDEPVVHLLE